MYIQLVGVWVGSILFIYYCDIGFIIKVQARNNRSVKKIFPRKSRGDFTQGGEGGGGVAGYPRASSPLLYPCTRLSVN